jgi:hypothetical protein
MRPLLFVAISAALTLSHSVHAAATRPADCTLTVDGRNYISGMCEFSATDKNGSFSIFGDKYWAAVLVDEGKGVAAWNAFPDGLRAEDHLGEVRRLGGCWVGPRARICALALDPARRDAIMARRPKGLSLSPEHMDGACVSAPGYRFVVGAALLLDRCDFQIGLRQKVFSRAANNVSIEGNPELCIDARMEAGAKEARLVLDYCAYVSIRWIYDEDEQVIRSSSGLCWDFRRDEGSKSNEPNTMFAHPCEHDPKKNGRFKFGVF